MKGLEDNEHAILAEMSPASMPCCAGPRRVVGPHEVPILLALQTRGLATPMRCRSREYVLHWRRTPVGQVALVADAAARGLVPMEMV